MSVSKIIRRERSERAIEDKLFTYPYLISPELTQVTRRQKILPSGKRLDLAFDLAEKIVVVEIKRKQADLSALQQLRGYLLELKKKEKKHTEGILVARTFTEKCLKTVDRKKKILSCKQLGPDIPLEIVICDYCRMARSRFLERCPKDGSREVLPFT